MSHMVLKPQDILVSLKLSLVGDEWTYASLAPALALSTGELHNSIKRIAVARLYNPVSRMVFRQSLLEFLIHGVKYAFPAERGGATCGGARSSLPSPCR